MRSASSDCKLRKRGFDASRRYGFANQILGDRPVAVELGRGLRHQDVEQRAAHACIPLIEPVGPAKDFESLLEAVLPGHFRGLFEQRVRFARPLDPLLGELFERLQLRIVGEFEHRFPHQRQRLVRIALIENRVDLRDPVGLGFRARLLLPALHHAIAFDIDARILAGDRAQNFHCVRASA